MNQLRVKGNELPVIKEHDFITGEVKIFQPIADHIYYYDERERVLLDLTSLELEHVKVLDIEKILGGGFSDMNKMLWVALVILTATNIKYAKKNEKQNKTIQEANEINKSFDKHVERTQRIIKRIEKDRILNKWEV